VRLVFVFALLAAAGLFSIASAAGESPLLTVTGNISRPNDGDSRVFDRDDLEALGLYELRTTTAWTNGVVTFEGVRLCDVLDAAGAEGEVIEAHALNDYVVEIPADDCRKYPVLIAMRQNGRVLRVRDRGPLWIVYPRDEFPELVSDIVNTRWVWQLDRLEVR
jgi:hypothetical protein